MILAATLARILPATFVFDVVRRLPNFAVLLACDDQSWLPIMAASTPNLHLPPNLREICAILATGLVRLSRNSALEVGANAVRVGSEVQVPLHIQARQSGGATPTQRRDA
jgi:hypothetical protein